MPRPVPSKALALLFAAVLVSAAPAGPGTAQETDDGAIRDLEIALTDLTAPTDRAGRGGCLATLRITSGGPARLETFSVRLALFGPDGTVLRALSVMAMPVAPDRPTVATFPTGADTCAAIAAVRVLGFPLCADGQGRSLACAGAARTDSGVEGVPMDGP